MDLVRCVICGKEHALEEAEIAYTYPDAYLEISADQREARADTHPDFCCLDRERFFVRCLIPIPLLDLPRIYRWGVWAEVEKDTFGEIVQTWRASDQESLPRLIGTIANEISYYGRTLGLRVELERRTDSRPLL